MSINVVFYKTAKLFPRVLNNFEFPPAMSVSSDCCTSVSVLDIVLFLQYLTIPNKYAAIRNLVDPQIRT